MKDMKKIIIIVLILSAIVTLIFMLFSVYSDLNYFTPGYKNSKIVSKLLPEGWGFFTRDPREPIYKLYEISDEKLTRIDMSNSAASTLLGLSRKNRRINIEFLRIKGLVADSVFTEIPLSDWSKAKQIEIINHSGYAYHFLKSGKYIVEKTNITPWIYKKNKYQYDQKKQIARFLFLDTKS